jgi:hypothetical protein
MAATTDVKQAADREEVSWVLALAAVALVVGASAALLGCKDESVFTWLFFSAFTIPPVSTWLSRQNISWVKILGRATAFVPRMGALKMDQSAIVHRHTPHTLDLLIPYIASGGSSLELHSHPLLRLTRAIFPKRYKLAPEDKVVRYMALSAFVGGRERITSMDTGFDLPTFHAPNPEMILRPRDDGTRIEHVQVEKYLRLVKDRSLSNSIAEVLRGELQAPGVWRLFDVGEPESSSASEFRSYMAGFTIGFDALDYFFTNISARSDVLVLSSTTEGVRAFARLPASMARPFTVRIIDEGEIVSLVSERRDWQESLATIQDRPTALRMSSGLIELSAASILRLLTLLARSASRSG